LGPHKIYIKIYSQRRLEKTEGRSAQKMVGKLVNEVKNTKIGFFDSIFLKEDSPVEKENLKFEEKSPNLDVYGLNWIFK
jgi:hypothetical protein